MRSVKWVTTTVVGIVKASSYCCRSSFFSTYESDRVEINFKKAVRSFLARTESMELPNSSTRINDLFVNIPLLGIIYLETTLCLKILSRTRNLCSRCKEMNLTLLKEFYLSMEFMRILLEHKNLNELRKLLLPIVSCKQFFLKHLVL